MLRRFFVAWQRTPLARARHFQRQHERKDVVVRVCARTAVLPCRGTCDDGVKLFPLVVRHLPPRRDAIFVRTILCRAGVLQTQHVAKPRIRLSALAVTCGGKRTPPPLLARSAYIYSFTSWCHITACARHKTWHYIMVNARDMAGGAAWRGRNRRRRVSNARHMQVMFNGGVYD